MSYRIETYQDGFIEDQFKIGSELYDPWPMGGQTRPDQLRQYYSQDDFDPETRFYAFNDEEMVGFLTSSFKEERDGKQYFFFEFPYVRQEHAPEAERQLIEHALDALTDKGADILVTRAGEYWGKTLSYAKEYGFEKTEDIARRGEIDLTKVRPSDFGDHSTLVSYDPEKHLKSLVSMYVDKFDAPKERVKQQLGRWTADSVGNTITSPWDHEITILAHKIAENSDEVIGRVVGMNHENFGEYTINLMQIIYKQGYDHKVGDMLAELVATGQKHDKTTLVLHTGQWGVSPDDELFEPYDISFEMKLAYFEKNL